MESIAYDAFLLLQADAGAQAVQIFDSWASELQPQDFDVFAGPYIQKIINSVRKTHPDLTIILYISGSGGLLERMAACRPDVVSVDQRVDMADAIKRIGPDFAVQVCSLSIDSVLSLYSCHLTLSSSLTRKTCLLAPYPEVDAHKDCSTDLERMQNDFLEAS